MISFITRLCSPSSVIPPIILSYFPNPGSYCSCSLSFIFNSIPTHKDYGFLIALFLPYAYNPLSHHPDGAGRIDHAQMFRSKNMYRVHILGVARSKKSSSSRLLPRPFGSGSGKLGSHHFGSVLRIYFLCVWLSHIYACFWWVLASRNNSISAVHGPTCATAAAWPLYMAFKATGKPQRYMASLSLREHHRMLYHVTH